MPYPLKRTASIRFELTRHQRNAIRQLGSVLWPDLHLSCDELCRRLLLEGADRLLEAQIPGDREALLEECCLPTGGVGLEAVRGA